VTCVCHKTHCVTFVCHAIRCVTCVCLTWHECVTCVCHKTQCVTFVCHAIRCVTCVCLTWHGCVSCVCHTTQCVTFRMSFYTSCDMCVSYVTCLLDIGYVTRHIDRKNPPPRGGFLFTMFPHQEPCVRGPPSKDPYQVLRGGSSYTRFLMREHSK